MSKITTVYNTLITAVTGLFTGGNVKTRIPNAENLPDNPFHFLRNGWGLTYEGAILTQGEFNRIEVNHTFIIKLTREVIKTDSNLTLVDIANKNLLEDSHTIRKDIFAVDKLGIPTDIEVNTLGGSTPIDFIITDKMQFRSTSITAIFRIAENL